MTPDRWFAFVAVLTVAVVVPGPDFAVALRSALSGIRPGLAAAAGIVTGLAVHTGAAALGLSALVATHPALLTGLRIAGACYLLLLGVQALAAAVRSRRDETGHGDPTPAVPAPPAAARSTPGRAYRAGLVVNLLNPKALLFFLGLLPQFVDPRAGSVAAQTLLLAGTTIAAAATWFALLVLAVARGRAVLTRPAARRRVDALAGVAFVGLAVKLGLG